MCTTGTVKREYNIYAFCVDHLQHNGRRALEWTMGTQRKTCTKRTIIENVMEGVFSMDHWEHDGRRV